MQRLQTTLKGLTMTGNCLNFCRRGHWIACSRTPSLLTVLISVFAFATLDGLAQPAAAQVIRSAGYSSFSSNSRRLDRERSALVGKPTSGAATNRRPVSKKSNVDDAFESRFWKYLIGNNYKNWSPAPTRPAGFFTGGSSHGPQVKMYINRTAAEDFEDVAMGSVVILENYRNDQSLDSISVMYRTAGYSPGNHDWFWIEYNPDGSTRWASATTPSVQNVSVGSRSTTSGTATNCIACHRSAAGEDFLFSNDPRDAQGEPTQPADQMAARRKETSR